MFDTIADLADLADLADFTEIDDAALAAAISGWTRAEAATAARRLAAIAEFVRRRANGPVECQRWSCDNWDSMAAEVAAAMGVSHGIASGQMHLGAALRERFPLVAAMFAEGKISARMVSLVVWRTGLIENASVLAKVDRDLTRNLRRYGRLSLNKATAAIDAIVDYHDPGALRRTRNDTRSREVVFDSEAENSPGITAFWGRLYSTDASVLDQRLTAMARELCDADPRTIAQRRADALGVLAAGGKHLACTCGNADCPAATDAGRGASAVVIHVVADKESLAAPADTELSGEGLAPVTSQLVRPAAKPPLLIGGEVLPNPLLAELVAQGAAIRTIRHPGASAPEPGYRPSAALAEFVRCRDLTCRFPNCDRPAQFCDIDHTIPYGDGGPTCASNLKLVCRKHHLLKTFWTAWHDEQRPDGTVIWTAPTGQRHTTHPGSSILFPTLCQPTAPVPPRTPGREPPTPQRSAMMPTRRCTRATDRARRIHAERVLNAEHVAERNRPPPF
ncbi:DUF222 domain-containing protein [Mycobacterium koreense]|uniref:HNH endonuclease n=1 Tax=Mycolicibacillus koreensis TaxID=1069220 RepID=A0A7I7SC23_9MYCO|nr:HNH endonuclease signature motif containing protein [Mycolicibacillus koreensis]MCV7248840.1 DUF222 domain-containing protein [Mycolicibacillus koreensis]ODR08289.1 hypothetical protein BHQ15_09280 [Mycolicibacillus koreensis]OSC36047.1 HNH endonuclease [Mycolicibacillus koreensis]BBY53686.1 HNH endonuclease [Mycolicibacillus koreensis]